MKKIKLILLTITLPIFIVACENYSIEEKEYINSIRLKRENTDNWMKNNSNSPFNFKGKVPFNGLNYFDVDPSFVFESKLEVYEEKDTIKIFGTKGEERSAIKFGYISFNKDNANYKLNVYQNIAKDSTIYYSVWFTDKTTNNQSYGVGRYLSFELNNNQDHVYTIDFNLSSNPYCAYSADYSCAIPSKEDYIDLAIMAGEKKYHE